jgi:hypothetical protein
MLEIKQDGKTQEAAIETFTDLFTRVYQVLKLRQIRRLRGERRNLYVFLQ